MNAKSNWCKTCPSQGALSLGTAESQHPDKAAGIQCGNPSSLRADPRTPFTLYGLVTARPITTVLSLREKLAHAWLRTRGRVRGRKGRSGEPAGLPRAPCSPAHRGQAPLGTEQTGKGCAADAQQVPTQGSKATMFLLPLFTVL